MNARAGERDAEDGPEARDAGGGRGAAAEAGHLPVAGTGRSRNSSGPPLVRCRSFEANYSFQARCIKSQSAIFWSKIEGGGGWALVMIYVFSHAVTCNYITSLAHRKNIGAATSKSR